MGQAPADIWEQPDGKILMKQMMFRYVNMYRMATMYTMKKNPEMLKPKPPKIPEAEKAIKEIEKPPPRPSWDEVAAVEADPEAAEAEAEDIMAQLEAHKQA